MLSGTGSLTEAGPGELQLAGTGISYTGNTKVNGGTLQFYNATNFAIGKTAPATTMNIASGAVLEMYTAGTMDFGTTNGVTLTGNGVFLKTGTGTLGLGNQGTAITTAIVNFNMTGGTIDIEGGDLMNGGWKGGVWTSNKASVNVASGATFDLWNGNAVYIDALTGSGTVTVGYAGTETLTIGDNNGSGFQRRVDERRRHLRVGQGGYGHRGPVRRKYLYGRDQRRAGMLVAANGVNGSALGSGTLTLNGGTLAAGAAGGSISGLVQAGSGPHVIAPGAALSSGYGTLNLNGGLTTNANTTLLLQHEPARPISAGIYGGDLINLGGSTLTVTGGTIAFVAQPRRRRAIIACSECRQHRSSAWPTSPCPQRLRATATRGRRNRATPTWSVASAAASGWTLGDRQWQRDLGAGQQLDAADDSHQRHGDVFGHADQRPSRSRWTARSRPGPWCSIPQRQRLHAGQRQRRPA